jgi:hypothetical protein
MGEPPEETDREFLQRLQKKDLNGDFCESDFRDAVTRILDHKRIEYETEKRVLPGIRRADIYLPDTDTAIELKLEPEMRGIGQCAHYSNHFTESILMSEGHDRGNWREVAEAAKKVPGVVFSVVTPGVTQSPPQFGIRTTAMTEFYRSLSADSVGPLAPEEELNAN